MKTRVIVTAIIKDKDRYFIAKRERSKRYAPGKWEFISGFVDSSKSADEIILNELKEEIKAKGKIIKELNPYVVIDKEARWIIIPFIIKIIDNQFIINEKEHSEIRWVSKKELIRYKDIRKDVMELGKMGVF